MNASWTVAPYEAFWSDVMQTVQSYTRNVPVGYLVTVGRPGRREVEEIWASGKSVTQTSLNGPEMTLTWKREPKNNEGSGGQHWPVGGVKDELSLTDNESYNEPGRLRGLRLSHGTHIIQLMGSHSCHLPKVTALKFGTLSFTRYRPAVSSSSLGIKI